MAKVQAGYDHFFEEFDRLAQDGADPGSREEVAELVNEVLTKEILAPAHEYLDFNEQVMATSTKQSQLMADRMVFGLLLLGLCGPVAGLLAGLAIARGVSRSIIQLSVPVHDAAGKLNEVVGPIVLSGGRGIEDLEAGLRNMSAEIGTVVNRLQQSQREVLRAEQLAAVGQLAAGVAHELRNPLMSMKLLAQTAAEAGDEARLEGRDIKVLCDAIGRVERSVQTFLDFARPPALERRAFDLYRVVEQTIHLVAGRAECQGVRIEYAATEEPLFIEADQGQIRQVLLNLLLNALDAMPKGGTVRIELPGSNGRLHVREVGKPEPVQPGLQRWLSIRVADTGCGLPVDLGERIFEPFITSKDTGVGLGLPICRRIVETHGGQITATNRPEGGAVFTVQLPLPAPDPQEATPSGNQVEEPLAVVPT
ncbi:MAG: histidine kinase [Planctomycetes bacterium]|nr:histidine kinase [Planctomycetota bacterium]